MLLKVNLLVGVSLIFVVVGFFWCVNRKVRIRIMFTSNESEMTLIKLFCSRVYRMQRISSSATEFVKSDVYTNKIINRIDIGTNIDQQDVPAFSIIIYSKHYPQ